MGVGVQELDKLLQWLEGTLKVGSNAFSDLALDTTALRVMRSQPTLAVAQANVTALAEVLHMDDAQVRLPQALALRQSGLHEVPTRTLTAGFLLTGISLADAQARDGCMLTPCSRTACYLSMLH